MEYMKKIVSRKYELSHDYMVTRDGKIYTPIYKRFLSTRLDKDGYEKVCLICKDSKHGHVFSVHRLVMETFCPIDNTSEMQVNHKDGNKLNNSLDNLEWCTCQENITHACITGLRKPKDQDGSKNHMAKLNEEKVLEIVELLKQGLNYTTIGKMYGVCSYCISNIHHKRSWNCVTKDIVF